MNRPLEEIRMRAGRLSVVNDELREECVAIARESSAQRSFKDAIVACRKYGIGGMEAIGVAKATRWLAVIRRDYGDEKFNQAVRTLAAATPTS
jgi:hypothetical protein